MYCFFLFNVNPVYYLLLSSSYNIMACSREEGYSQKGNILTRNIYNRIVYSQEDATSSGILDITRRIRSRKGIIWCVSYPYIHYTCEYPYSMFPHYVMRAKNINVYNMKFRILLLCPFNWIVWVYVYCAYIHMEEETSLKLILIENYYWLPLICRNQNQISATSSNTNNNKK